VFVLRAFLTTPPSRPSKNELVVFTIEQRDITVSMHKT
jgi:hypothetical protein